MKPKILKIVIILTIILVDIGCDQSTKYYVRTNLERHTTFNVLGNLILIRYTENDGGFLGLGADLPPLPSRSYFSNTNRPYRLTQIADERGRFRIFTDREK